MKKVLLLLVCAFLLTVCSANNGEKEKTSNGKDGLRTDTNANGTNEVAKDPSKDVANDHSNEKSQSEESKTQTESQGAAKNNTNSDAGSKYPEYAVIMDKLEVDHINYTVGTDNPNKRILIFNIDGEKRYKSIYIKKSNILKVIDIKNNHQIFFDKHFESK